VPEMESAVRFIFEGCFLPKSLDYLNERWKNLEASENLSEALFIYCELVPGAQLPDQTDSGLVLWLTDRCDYPSRTHIILRFGAELYRGQPRLALKHPRNNIRGAFHSLSVRTTQSDRALTV